MDLTVLKKISYGLYIIASKSNDKINGQIVNTVFQVTSQPPTLAVSINKKNLTYKYIKDSNIFTLSIISKECPFKTIGKFGFKSGRDIDKYSNENYIKGITGAPILLDYTLAYLECKVIKIFDVGTHTLFIGKLVASEILNSNKEPLTYKYYHEVIKGKEPKTAPTYIKEMKNNRKEMKSMEKYVCTACGYVYDPQKGDPDSGIKPGTPFKDLPDDWVCPVCGVGKDMFEVQD